MNQPLVSLITINFNGKGFLEPLLTSVEAQDYPADRIEIIMVDNGSTDGSVEYVEGAFPKVRVLRNTENMGFAKANNQAAEIATGQYLALINNDMKLEPDWVSNMVAAVQKGDDDLVCVGSKILNWDGSLVDFIGGTLSFNGMGFQTNFHAPVDSPAGRAYASELLFACGGAMLIDRAVYLEVGGFDEDYFAYFEDVDLGWRLWVLGYRVGFCPDAIAYHRHNGTSSQFGWYRKLVLFERNALYSLIKNYDAASLNAFLPAALLLATKRMAMRSGVRREEFSFTLPSASKSASPSPAPRKRGRFFLAKKALGVLRREGIKSCVKKTGLKLAHIVIRRWSGPSQPVSDVWRPVRYDAYSTVVAIEDLIDHLPKLMEKREWIQSRRRRADEEILTLFKTPFQPSESQEDYPEAFFATIQALGAEDYFLRRIGGEATLAQEAPR